MILKYNIWFKHFFSRALFSLTAASFIFFAGCKKDTPTEPQPSKPPGYQEDIPWPSLADSPWPMFQHDPQFTGRSKYPGPAMGVIEWQKEFNGGSDIAFLTASAGNVYLALGSVSADPANNPGAYLFSFQSNGILKHVKRLNTNNFSNEINCSPLISKNDIISAVSGSGVLMMLDSLNNKIIEHNLGTQVFSGYDGINIDKNGNLYLGTQNELLVLNSSGDKLWAKSEYKRQSVVISPVGSRIYIKRNGFLDALDLSGNVIWSHPVTPGDYAVIHKVVDSYGNLYVMDENTIKCLSGEGVLKWSYSPDASENLQVDVAQSINKIGDIYFLSDKNLYSVNHKGELNWKFPAENFNGSHLVNDLNGNVYITKYSGGEILSVSSAGTLNWSLNAGTDYTINSAAALTENNRLILMLTKGNKSYLVSIK